MTKVIRSLLASNEHFVETKIYNSCRSVDDFSLAEPMVKNLARIHIDRLFPVQVWCRHRI